ncbi:DUF4062 domain-containing protein [Spirosoma spitsbergense]|uniref:DUF4062 domain-containing protein n=1 Tax=Spirosoma spitsbergense TaxID=431554 RepID=UPI00039B6BA4|nr:DUF4062 domain-containing protein [Spirosoma spitsbergense]
MAKNAPTVMISSTYYDLRDIRQDLVNFIEKELGYNALASEFDSFPVDPDANTIENCRRRVDRDADILILVIGGRYGYVDDKTAKSVTNLEYLTARAKGIPIYAFVDKRVLPLLPIWEQNPEAKFDGAVSDTKVFEFIRQVRSVDMVWTHEFEYAQAIIQTLRLQFAHQMKEGLLAIQRLSSAKESIPEGISGKALRLILEQPLGWEHYFFAQVLSDEVDRRSDLREEHRLRFKFSEGEVLTTANVFDWADLKYQEMIRIAGAGSDLVNNHLKTALGPPGQPSNIKALVFVAKKLGETYQRALEISQGIRHTYCKQCLQPYVDEMATGLDDLIDKVGGFGPLIMTQIDKALLSPKETREAIRINLVLESTLGEHTGDLLRECLENCEYI